MAVEPSGFSEAGSDLVLFLSSLGGLVEAKAFCPRWEPVSNIYIPAPAPATLVLIHLEGCTEGQNLRPPMRAWRAWYRAEKGRIARGVQIRLTCSPNKDMLHRLSI